MNQDFVDLLQAFVAHDVRFLVVGAYALNNTMGNVYILLLFGVCVAEDLLRPCKSGVSGHIDKSED